ncbi:MAG: UvrD-helicase domain-containing protein [Gammaproteobacteria bacterium]|uniref:UvrD-helicase domain-containing protein n=1 Tax=Rhodoferax sp. TaxID=50421 RepID=UPI0018142A3F|nr:UvrD-helicase domain-containing protein [Rhodoferax sp.]MBU3900079.1 UvrD-helicase domain-containing protein [Gammaproteobacteria bacterium]MBA3059754.1 AAA family ATPase [Rhodoferax sp.]MBU3996523.1 UvrD-helicase domain-containing protein [Gammaproteobacteria bacterium]MBU4018263.1 UvrD-helicase domain-containing protein [Gammaproteobacteria bacterium]MBU4082117.1 UvrD-helicase domain-containing protein [Gammaproteobacteria bacterium]
MPSPQPAPAYEHNGQLISAEAFYAIACDPRRSVAVEACAGAGKTWMLVSRIVRALLDGLDANTGELRVQPHEILAITFTKRAASEMRERLYQWLAEFAVADHATLRQELKLRGVLDEIWLQPSSLLPEQLSNLYKNILQSGRQVQVRTFHSWFAALLRSAPLAVLQQMELPANYQLLEDDAPAKALVWRRFYAALLRPKPRPVEGSEWGGDAPDDSTDATLQFDYEAVVFDYGRAQTDKALQTALDKRTEFALADAQGVVLRSVLPFGTQFPEFADLATPDDFLRDQPERWQTLLAAAKALGGASAKTFSAKGVELEMALTRGDLSGAFAALLTDKDAPRKFSEKIAGIEAVREAQELVLRVLAARLQHAAWLYQQRMARLTRALLREFAALKREHGWVDMNDVERAALVLLSDPVLCGWVQERLDARIKHLLIDEFQDTNPLQWQALKSWLSGYVGAGGGATAPRVFIVGDPKQSIYRFRRAEPQVFKAAKAFVRDGLSGDLLSCDHTRRNAIGVIAVVNAVMTQAAQADGYEGFRAHTTSAVDVGLVCRLPPIARPERAAVGGEGAVGAPWRDSLSTPRELPEETLRTLEARQAAQWIAQQLASAETPGPSLQAADVMVLSRKRAGLLPLQLELRKLHIAAQIGEKTNLIDCCEVQDLVALLDVLVSPRHNLSLARVLKSPLFDMPDAALVQLAQAVQAHSQPPDELSWFEVLQHSELYTQDGRWLAPCLMRWKGWLDQWPPHDALQAIYFDGDVLARFAAAAPASQRDAVLANLNALLAVSLQLDGGRFATPYAFVRALKNGGVLAPATVNPQALRLLTVHGAKGLEAQLVLLLDTDTPERNADTMGVLIDWPGEAAWPSKFVFLASESQPPACSLPTLAAERLERQREELNALYVALTRSRRTLAISSIAPYRSAERSWWQRLSELAQPVALAPAAAVALAATETATSAALISPAAENAVFYIKELPLAHVGYAPTAIKNGSRLDVGRSGEGADALDALSARLGLAMHRLLEWGEASKANVAACAREFALTPEQGAQAAAMAARILQGEGAWAWDNSVLAWQGNEVELLYRGQCLRLDRLVQRAEPQHAGHWWVLDYKSAPAPQEQPALLAQLHHYRAAVQAIHPDAVVKAAFLSAHGALIEMKDTDEMNEMNEVNEMKWNRL